ncbi:MAG: TRAP transporter small permease [Dehalococcoidales bacterium]|nr:TRAP transporter small permease [Dehalococcoidales bacterium]
MAFYSRLNQWLNGAPTVVGAVATLSRWLNRVLIVIGAVAMLSMMLIVVGNSLGRAIFKTPIFGTIEDVGLAGVVLIAVAIGLAERERVNIVIRALFEHLPRRVQLACQIFTFLLSLVAVGYLFYSVLGSGLESLEKDEHTIVTQVPMAPFRIFWAFGILVLWLFLARHLVETIIKIAVRKNE